jgi:hypothetical protein
MMWGFTANSINRANNMPAITQADGVSGRLKFARLAAINSKMPQAKASQV